MQPELFIPVSLSDLGRSSINRSLRSEVSRGKSGQSSRMTEERKRFLLMKVRYNIPRIAEERKEKIKLNIAMSRLSVLDAFAGRLKNGLAVNSTREWWIYLLFCIQTSDVLYALVIMTSVLHTFSLFIEPAPPLLPSLPIRFLQMVFVIIYAADISFKMGYEGIHEYFKHDWQQLYFLNLLLHVIDLSLNGHTKWTTPLRPVAGVLRARKGRKFFEVLKWMVPDMISDSLVPMLFFLIIVTGLCCTIFSESIGFFDGSSGIATAFYEWWFLIFTNDNFSRLLPRSLETSLYSLFFFPVLYVGQRFLLNLIIGETYGTFRDHSSKQLLKEKQKEMQGLTKAFRYLDDIGTGTIGYSTWSEFMHSFLPDVSDEAVAVYFELLSGGNNRISILQFLSLRPVLAFKLVTSTSETKSKGFERRLRFFFRALSTAYQSLKVPDFILTANLFSSTKGGISSVTIAEFCRRITSFCDENSVWARANLLDIAILTLGLSDWPLARMAGLMITPCRLISLWYFCEYTLRLIGTAQGKFSAVSKGGNFITLIFAVGTVGSVAYAPLLQYLGRFASFDLGLNLAVQFPVHEVLLSLRLLRCLRLGNLNQELRAFNTAIVDIFPALFETFTFTFIVSYLFGTIGYLLFSSNLIAWQTPIAAVVKAQQMTFMSGFLDSTEEAMDATHPLACCYFLFYLIISLAVSNIALSIIIDLHADVLEDLKGAGERNKAKIDKVFEQIIERAKLRHCVFVDRKWSSLNFSNIKMSNFQSSDVRQFICTKDHERKLTRDDIELCQIESNIDLVKFYEKMLRHRPTVLNEELEALQRLRDEKLEEISCFPGQPICFKGEECPELLLITKGRVRVRADDIACSPSRSEEVIEVNALVLLGALGLKSVHQFSVSAADEGATVMLIPQDAVGDYLDPDLVAFITRLSFHSYEIISNLFIETARRTPRLSKVSNVRKAIL